MDTQPKTSYLAAKTLSLTFFLFVIAILLMATNLTSSNARQEKRVLENTIPERVPIKIKIKKQKEKSFEALQNEKWLSEFELEVTNTGDKPIYYLDLLLVSDVKLGGNYLVFPLSYGRDALGDIVSKAGPDDVPIKPAETIVFKIHPGQIPAWEKSVREGTHPEARRLQIKMEALSFGDGTGLFGNSGTVYPAADRKQSGSSHELENPNKMEAKNARSPGVQSNTQAGTSTTAEMPVSFLPANFLSSDSNTLHNRTNSLAAASCLFDFCVGVAPAPRVHVCYNCPPQNRPTWIQPALARNSSTVQWNVRLEP